MFDVCAPNSTRLKLSAYELGLVQIALQDLQQRSQAHPPTDLDALVEKVSREFHRIYVPF